MQCHSHQRYNLLYKIITMNMSHLYNINGWGDQHQSLEYFTTHT